MSRVELVAMKLALIGGRSWSESTDKHRATYMRHAEIAIAAVDAADKAIAEEKRK